MYKVIYIDENRDDVDLFMELINLSQVAGNLKIVHKEPLHTIDAMIQWISDNHPDGLVVDYKLNEIKDYGIDYNVPYDGAGLIQRFLEIRPEFPCFIMTSFEDDATGCIDDVNMVYQRKEEYVDGEMQGLSFADRVVRQIEHYQNRIQDAEKEFSGLLEKQAQTKGLTAKQEERLSELDAFLEKSLNSKQSIPLRSKSFTDDLHNLIKNTDELLEGLRNGE
ncbi:MAG: hypothetical protein PF904_19485 [Kiritimatiellae bacterium]|jgi:hypothetical protein|nr:hypothetical protein [Kiritimatiellia bacterium]